MAAAAVTANEGRPMPTVDGEDLKQAEEVKYENLQGPSEEELSKEREAKVAYIPPPPLVPAPAPAPRKASKGD
jgi:hypothetical protein